MSFLTGRFLRHAQPIVAARPVISISKRPSRYLSTTGRKAAMSENDHHQDDDSRKAAIDEHKEDQLNKQKDSKGHWKRELSSTSESAVKADREEITDAKHDIESLQKHTAETHQDAHEHGKK